MVNLLQFAYQFKSIFILLRTFKKKQLMIVTFIYKSILSGGTYFMLLYL